MNKVILMGRLTRDPEVRYSQSNTGDGQMAIARYTLAVDRRFNKWRPECRLHRLRCIWQER